MTDEHRKLAHDWLEHAHGEGECKYEDEDCLAHLLADFERKVRLEALEEAAKECERVMEMPSKEEWDELVPKWSNSELGAEVLCAASIRRIAALEKPK